MQSLCNRLCLFWCYLCSFIKKSLLMMYNIFNFLYLLERNHMKKSVEIFERKRGKSVHEKIFETRKTSACFFVGSDSDDNPFANGIFKQYSPRKTAVDCKSCEYRTFRNRRGSYALSFS